MKIINIFPKSKFLVLSVCIILFVLPFFWLKPGELELGGDSSRLYLYDPGAFLQADSLYSISPNGMGDLRSDQSMLPFLLLLKIFYSLFHSPYILTCLLYSLNLVGAFLFVYLIVIEIIKSHAEQNKTYVVEIAAVLAGLFYAFSPSVGRPMQYALIIHNQVFLNPMIFYLMLRFLLSQKSKYLWFMLLTTFIFSPNFTLAVPALFSFYPLAFTFLGLYIVLCLGKSLPWKKLIIYFIIFLGIHAFHILPVIVNTFDPTSYYNTRLFNAKSIQNEGINYFNAILPYAMVTKSFFYTYSTSQAQWAVFVGPLCIILGFLFSKARQKDFTLIATFFFITTFLESANITQIGIEFYRKLFYIPGFSMFRNFYGQWQWVQAFFYALLLGYSFFLIFYKLKRKTIYILSALVVGLLIFSNWMFVSGQILRQPHRATKGVSTIIVMDPNFEKALTFLKNQPDDGKIFDLPFTEFSYQVIPGLNKGAYIGPSPTSFLTGRRDFSGQIILYPFSDTFLKLISEENYVAIKRLFGLLNIEYIFYNADPRDYKEFFPELPYTLLLKVLPDSQALANFVGNIADKIAFQRGNYSVYYSDMNYYLPHFYVPTTIIPYDKKDDYQGENTSFYIDTKQKDPRIGYVSTVICKLIYLKGCKADMVNIASDIPKINFKKINPTKYRVIVSGAKNPFLLIFSDKFHNDWKAFILNDSNEKMKVQKSYFNGNILESYHENIFFNSKTFETIGMKSLPDKQHISINGYANAWYITPTDSGGKTDYEVIIEMVQQRTFYSGLLISLVSIVIFVLYGIKLLKN